MSSDPAYDDRARSRSLAATALALIRLGRLHFLAGGVLLHLLGVAMALYAGAPLNVAALLWGQIAITATQLMTHYANDYFDLDADRANRTPTNWSGGSRVLVERAVPPHLALRVALGAASVALVANLVLSLVVQPGLTTFALLGLAQLAAWFYSAPPLRLHSRGLGEATTMIVVTLLTPLTGYALHARRVDLLPLLVSAPLCCIQFAMLLAIEFPDAEGDRLAGKRTLVVTFGGATAIRLYVGFVVPPFLILPALVVLGLPAANALAVALLLPLAIGLLWHARRGDWRRPERWNGFAFHTIVLLMASAAAQFGALLLLIGTR
ncbi:MAG: prenyltransferase [Chloroflexi bacterium]|nr:prenyltransferase [Chloroflexota bacterium]